jgi:hypothetical protein
MELREQKSKEMRLNAAEVQRQQIKAKQEALKEERECDSLWLALMEKDRELQVRFVVDLNHGL